jgi:hypothetical protein
MSPGLAQGIPPQIEIQGDGHVQLFSHPEHHQCEFSGELDGRGGRSRPFLQADIHETENVYRASADIEWSYKETMVKSDEHTFCNLAEYTFTCSQAMNYDRYFHPSYPVEWDRIAGK